MSEKVTAMWMGKDVNEMTKAELIKALCELAQIYEQDSKGHINSVSERRGI